MRTALFATALLLWATPLVTNAQEEPKKKPQEEEKSNGLRLGYNMTNFAGVDIEADARHGYYGGIYRNFIKIPLYCLSVGVEYNSAGAVGDNAEQRLGYITLPINNRLKLGMVYFDGGADIQYKIGEKFLLDGSEVDIPDDQKAETWDVMLHAGAGIKILMFGIEARYRYGLTEPYNGVHNTSLQLGLTTFF